MPIRRTGRHLANTLVTGILAALPLAVTVFIVGWLLRLLHDWVGPGSFFGRQLARLGFDVTSSDLVAWLIGVGLLVAALYLLGLLVQTRLRNLWHHAIDGLLGRIPLVRQVYELVQRFVGLLQQRDESATRSMSPVWLHFGGGTSGARVLGLLSTSEPVWMDGQPFLGVIVPTAPVPVGGALIYVPQAWVQPAGLGMEALTSVYVSMGVTSAQHLGDRAATSPRSA
ncbi:MAG: DUF502 domain-containing protein [Rubrivivax sp.]|nr:DUF502 domain-containing protein [Rubrivivax sp.]